MKHSKIFTSLMLTCIAALGFAAPAHATTVESTLETTTQEVTIDPLAATFVMRFGSQWECEQWRSNPPANYAPVSGCYLMIDFAGVNWAVDYQLRKVIG